MYISLLDLCSIGAETEVRLHMKETRSRSAFSGVKSEVVFAQKHGATIAKAAVKNGNQRCANHQASVPKN